MTCPVALPASCCSWARVAARMALTLLNSLSSSAFSPLNLYLHYAEMPREKQYQYESRVISSMEALGKEFLQNIATLRCNVRYRLCGDDILLEFCTGGFEGLQCRIQKNCTFQLAPL